MSSANVLEVALEVLKRYTLCDRCLGRLFGYLGKGLSNLERGKALKMSVVLEVHRGLQEKKLDVGVAREILLNAQMNDVAKLLNIASGAEELRPCFICGNRIEEWIERLSSLAISKLQDLKASSFLIGITSAQEPMRREELIAVEFGLGYRETIKRELKREIGKRVSSALGIKPDFSYPDVVLVADVASGEIVVNYPSLILYGYYWKYGRGISQSVLLDKNGRRRCQLSIEDAVESAGRAIGAQGCRVHTTGGEGADIRVLGSGKPIVIEFRVLRKDVDMGYIESVLNSFSPWLRFSIRMRTTRDIISRLKVGARSSRRIYRAIVYTHTPVTLNDLSLLESVFRDRIVEQRTPTRVLKHKKDTLKRLKVYLVKVVPIAPQLFEALIDCDGGLYVKELVTGDGGRTRPSFSEILGCATECLMLDLLYVHEHI